MILRQYKTASWKAFQLHSSKYYTQPSHTDRPYVHPTNPTKPKCTHSYNAHSLNVHPIRAYSVMLYVTNALRFMGLHSELRVVFWVRVQAVCIG